MLKYSALNFWGPHFGLYSHTQDSTGATGQREQALLLILNLLLAHVGWPEQISCWVADSKDD